MGRRYKKRHPLTGLIVGAISGLTGTVVMTQSQNLWNKVSEEMHTPKTEEGGNRADAEQKEEEEKEKEDSTMKAAGKISEEIGQPLSREERKKM